MLVTDVEDVVAGDPDSAHGGFRVNGMPFVMQVDRLQGGRRGCDCCNGLFW